MVVDETFVRKFFFCARDKRCEFLFAFAYTFGEPHRMFPCFRAENGTKGSKKLHFSIRAITFHLVSPLDRSSTF